MTDYNKEKADVFAEHLERTFGPNEEKTLVNSRRRVKMQINHISPIKPKEIIKEIKTNIDPKKYPGFDLITGEILRQLAKKAIVKLTYLYIAAFRLKYVPSYWKTAEVIKILKPGKPATEATSYRPLSLLPVLSKLFEKLLLERTETNAG